MKRWLVDSGISHDTIVVPKSRGSVHFSTTVDKLETILQARYHVYHHARGDAEHIGTDEYSLPQDISDVVDFVVPGLAMMRKRAESGSRNQLARRRTSNALAKASNVTNIYTDADGKSRND